MKSNKNPDYTALTQHAAHCGMVPATNRLGQVVDGFYTLKGYNAPVDLTASALDEKSIMRNALKQLSQSVDEAFHNSIESDLKD